MPLITTWGAAFAIWKNPYAMGDFRADVQRFGRLIRKETRPGPTRLVTNPTVGDVLACVRDGKGMVAVDIETGPAHREAPWTGKDPTQAKLRTIGLGNEEWGLSHVWGDDATVEQAIKGVLADPSVLKIGHNFLWFDQRVLERYGCATHNLADTRDQRRALSSTSRLALAYVTSLYDDAPPWKQGEEEDDSKGIVFTDDYEALKRYNAEDCVRTARIHGAMNRESEWNTPRVRRLYDVHVELSQLAAEMHTTGIPVDFEQRAKLDAQLRDMYHEREKHFLRLVDIPGMRCTPQDLRALIFKRHENSRVKRFSLEDPIDPNQWVQKKYQTIAVDQNALLLLLVQPGIPAELKGIIDAYWQAEGAKKARSTYVISEKVSQAIGPDVRIRPGWNSCGTDTGRFSCIARGTPIEVVRDVSVHPKGIPIEAVRPGDYAYTYDALGVLRLRKVLRVIHKGRQPVVRLHWRGSGHHTRGFVDLTADHRVRLVSGVYVRADSLTPKDRVMALSRSHTNGYARLHPTGSTEVREHRLIASELLGGAEQHVHHRNGNKLDNRLENLENLSAAEHASLHGQICSPQMRAFRSSKLKEQHAAGTMWVPSGADHPHYLGLTREYIEHLLVAHDWSITLACRAGGHDFNTFKKYAIAVGFDLAELKKMNRTCRRGNTPNNHEVLCVEHLNLEEDVYDLEIEETHNFIAGEICVHNCNSPNLLNLAKKKDEDGGALVGDLPDMRSMYRAPPGWVLVEADYSQQELRVMWLVSGDDVLGDALRSGDVYTQDAIDIFGLPVTSTKATIKKEARHTAKTGHLGFQYGAGTPALYKQFLEQDRKMTFSACMLVHKALKRRYAKTVTYWEAEMYRVLECGYSESRILGRRRTYPREPPITETANYPIQATSSDITNLATLDLWKALKKYVPPAKIVISQYDAAYVMTPERHVEEVKHLMQECMEQPFTINGKQATFPVDFSVKERWGTL